MKRIGILSDTHGNRDVIDRILLQEERTCIDMWLHAGDYGDDGRYLAGKISVPMYAVRGNTDFRVPFEPLEQLIGLEDTLIYMVHGHQFDPFQRVNGIFFMAQQYKAKLVVTGHTHCYELLEEDGCIMVNPGSAAKPRDGRLGSYVIAVYERGRFRVERKEITNQKLYL